MADMAPPAETFEGFRPAALAFFRDLAANQQKAWFEANRAVYETEVQAPLRALVCDLCAALARREVPLTADPKKAAFRIHRDVRFSRDKSPYKTHVGAILSRDGSKTTFGVLYLHIDPNGSFMAAGFHQPEPKLLELLRGAMLEEPERLLGALDTMQQAGGELSREDPLTRLPRGFEHGADTPVADLLKLRSLIAHHPLPAPALSSRSLVDDVAGFAEAALPLLRFGWDAL